jgi:predicted alpha/beta hydrolase family esterase
MEVLNQYKDQIDENTIMIGHSLGGLFLVKVLEQLEKPIKTAVFVATPIGIPPVVNWAGDAPFLKKPFDWEKIRKNAKNIIVYHSDNDPYVGLENGKKLAENLGGELSFVPGAGHFNKKAGYLKFEELLEDLKIIKR